MKPLTSIIKQAPVMNTNNPQRKRYSAPEMMALIIHTERLCAGSQAETQTATHENYTTFEMFD